MPATARLSALDASFLEIESTTAHMHVGWVATFLPPADGTMPTFDDLRDHIASRLCRAPRYRQRLAGVPLGLDAPEWVDAESFDIADHVLHSTSRDCGSSPTWRSPSPLNRQRPLWELWIADELADGRIGVVGKAHHCLVDGIAAVELAGLLLDPSPIPRCPTPAVVAAPRARPDSPHRRGRARPDGRAGRDAEGPARAVAPPRRNSLASRTTRAARRARWPSRSTRRRRAAAQRADLAAAAPRAALAPARGPEDDQAVVQDHAQRRRARRVRRGSARLHGGARRRARAPEDDGAGQRPGRRCRCRPGQPDLVHFHRPAVRRARSCRAPDAIHEATSARKAAGNPRGADSVLRALGFAPRVVQQLAAHAAASSRAYNLTISNIPGPPEAAWMRGCRLEAAHPVIPLSDNHALSIGLTTIGDGAHFGVYCDRKRIPDADMLAGRIDLAVDELLALAT